MKFLMVMIICFAEDTCQAVFDATQFNTYDQCMEQALPVSRYMKDVYTTSAGEIHCLDEPALSLNHPEHSKSSI